MAERKKGVGVFLRYGHDVFLMLRDNKDTILNPLRWSLPGGGIEGDETPEHAAWRELKEEFSIEPPLELIGISSEGNGFFAGVLSGQEAACIRGEGCESGFFSYEAIMWLNALGDVKGGLGGAIRRLFVDP